MLKGDQNNEKQKRSLKISKIQKLRQENSQEEHLQIYLLQYNGLNKLTPFKADRLKEEEKTIKKLQNMSRR